MNFLQLTVLAALADRQLPGIAQNLGPLLDGGSLLLTGFVLRPAGDDDFDGDPESEENAQCGWVFEVHAAAIGGGAGVGNVAVKMLLSFSPKLSRDTVIEHLDRESKARFPGDAPGGTQPTHFTVIVELDAFGTDADGIRERISSCLGTHPTLSLRVESVQAIEGASFVPMHEAGHAVDDKLRLRGMAKMPVPFGHDPHVGAYGMPQAADPDDFEKGRIAARAGEPRTAPDDVFTDAWEAGYDEVAGPHAAPIVAYDRDDPPRLPANAFKPGDRVMAVDPVGGETHSGTVPDSYDPARSRDGDVLVWVDSFDYEPGSLGTLIVADILRLWPARLHRLRLFEVATGELLDRTAAGLVTREDGETDDAFRQRAVSTWAASGSAL